MYSIASLLDPSADEIVRALWERFEEHCGLTGIKITPLPHFSWLGAEAYHLDAVEPLLTEQAAKMKPFTVQTAGLGMFTGPRPVVYIALVKNETLLDVHKALWESLRPHAEIPNGFYDPNRWMPHITLAFREIDPERLGCAVADIAFQKVDFKFTVDHFAVIYQANGNAGLHSRIAFGNGAVLEGGNSENSGIASRFTKR